MTNDITARVLLDRNTDLKFELDIRCRHIAALRAYKMARGDKPTMMQLWRMLGVQS